MVEKSLEQGVTAPGHEWKHYRYDDTTGQLAMTVLTQEAAIETPEPRPSSAEDILAVGPVNPAEHAKEVRYAEVHQLPYPQPSQAPGRHEQ